MLKKILKFASSHKIIAGIAVILIIGGAYFGYRAVKGNSGEIRYVLATVEKGTITLVVSGSGQVSVSNQVDIKARASGDVVYVGVENGQEVKAGTLLAQLDATDAQKAVRDAEANLEEAKLSLEKLKAPPDNLSLIQAENSLAQARESKQNTEDDLKKSYDDGFTRVADAFIDLPNVMSGIQSILFSSNFGTNKWNIDFYADVVRPYDSKVDVFRNDAFKDYQNARQSYNQNFDDYKSSSRFSDTATIEKLINQTYDTSKLIAEAVKSTNDIIQFYKDKLVERNLKPEALADTHLASLNTYTGKMSSHLLNLLSIKNTIDDDKAAFINAERSISEKTEALAKLKSGPDELDIRSQELAIKQRENALLDAKEKLADYFVRAPFEGVIAKINVKKGDPLSANTAVATFITKQRIAEISLNEVDVAKIKVGQKATLAFDAVPDLGITGEVAEIDTVGTVLQGVVSYTVKTTFDTQDERVKPGMSVSTNIITDAKPNVLMAPNSAVKSQGSIHYVEVKENEKVQPRRQQVEIGISNDEFTEIVSGLKEGDIVVSGTINPQTSTNTNTSQSQNSGFSIPGLPGGAGGAGGGMR